MTIGQFKQLSALFSQPSKPVPFQVGESYFFRCVTYHVVGKVKEIVGDFIVFEDSAWVALSERFADTLRLGTIAEVEATPPGVINMTTIVDAYPWQHPTPTESK